MGLPFLVSCPTKSALRVVAWPLLTATVLMASMISLQVQQQQQPTQVWLQKARTPAVQH
jgi:hypothetical protein